MVSEFEIKKQICDIGKRIYNKGMVAANDGNISVKISDNEFLCTPTGVSKGFMTPEYICKVDADGNVLQANEGFIKRVFKEVLDVDVKTPFLRMPYREAMDRFGSDKPDTRFGLELFDIGDIQFIHDCFIQSFLSFWQTSGIPIPEAGWAAAPAQSALPSAARD